MKTTLYLSTNLANWKSLICCGTSLFQDSSLFQKQSLGVLGKKRCSQKFPKIHRETPVPESFFLIKLQNLALFSKLANIYQTWRKWKRLKVNKINPSSKHKIWRLKDNDLLQNFIPCFYFNWKSLIKMRCKSSLLFLNDSFVIIIFFLWIPAYLTFRY